MRAPTQNHAEALHDGMRARTAARAADYAWLRGHGFSIQQAAWRMGVSKRTAERYERRLRENPVPDV